MNIEWYQISIVVAIAFAIFEVFTTTYIALGFAIGTLFTALLQYIFGDFDFNRDATSFAVVSLITIVVIRRYFSKRTDQNVLNQDDVNLY